MTEQAKSEKCAACGATYAEHQGRADFCPNGKETLFESIFAPAAAPSTPAPPDEAETVAAIVNGIWNRYSEEQISERDWNEDAAIVRRELRRLKPAESVTAARPDRVSVLSEALRDACYDAASERLGKLKGKDVTDAAAELEKHYIEAESALAAAPPPPPTKESK